jgi:hypothetical protein
LDEKSWITQVFGIDVKQAENIDNDILELIEDQMETTPTEDIIFSAINCYEGGERNYACYFTGLVRGYIKKQMLEIKNKLIIPELN